jgi:uncharacterized protein YndB with AHSA1/START domain
MNITVEAFTPAPLASAWCAYSNPADIQQWNAASDDWHTPRAAVDFREGGRFSSRMEAKDGSMGFDFEGTYTRIVEHQLIEYTFGDRTCRVTFAEQNGGTAVTVTFEAETEFSPEQQRQGWQAILDRFARHVASKG